MIYPTPVDVRFTGMFVDGKKSGYGVMEYKAANHLLSKYEGEYKDDVREDKVSYININLILFRVNIHGKIKVTVFITGGLMRALLRMTRDMVMEDKLILRSMILNTFGRALG